MNKINIVIWEIEHTINDDFYKFLLHEKKYNSYLKDLRSAYELWVDFKLIDDAYKIWFFSYYIDRIWNEIIEGCKWLLDKLNILKK